MWRNTPRQELHRSALDCCTAYVIEFGVPEKRFRGPQSVTYICSRLGRYIGAVMVAQAVEACSFSGCCCQAKWPQKYLRDASFCPYTRYEFISCVPSGTISWRVLLFSVFGAHRLSTSAGPPDPLPPPFLPRTPCLVPSVDSNGFPGGAHPQGHVVRGLRP